MEVPGGANALATATETLTTALGRAPDDAEVAAMANLSEAEVREVRSGTDRATLLTLDPLANEGEGLLFASDHILERITPNPTVYFGAAAEVRGCSSAIW